MFTFDLVWISKIQNQFLKSLKRRCTITPPLIKKSSRTSLQAHEIRADKWIYIPDHNWILFWTVTVTFLYRISEHEVIFIGIFIWNKKETIIKRLTNFLSADHSVDIETQVMYSITWVSVSFYIMIYVCKLRDTKKKLFCVKIRGRKSVFSILLSSIYINISSVVIQKKGKENQVKIWWFFLCFFVLLNKQGRNLQIHHPSQSLLQSNSFTIAYYFQ